MPRKTFVTELIFNIFADLQVGKYAEYHISSNKRWASNKHFPLISTAPKFQNLISASGTYERKYMSSVMDVFLGTFQKFSEQLC